MEARARPWIDVPNASGAVHAQAEGAPGAHRAPAENAAQAADVARAESSRTRSLLDAAALLVPADGRSWRIEHTVRRHTHETAPGQSPRDVDVLIHVVAPLAPGAVTRRSVGARRSLLRSIRRSAGHRTVVMHPVSGAALRPGPRDAVRRFLSGGAVIEVVSRPGSRLLDVAAVQAGVDATGRLHFTTRGQAAAIGTDTIFRAASAGTPGDPSWAGAGLAEAVGTRRAPRLVDAGNTLGVSWTVESKLTGRRPRQLFGPLLEDVVEFASSLPAAATGTRPSWHADLETIAAALPARGRAIAGLVRRAGSYDGPFIAAHGDLWTGNLLSRRGHLSGVVDWDDWAPCTVPGADLIHLLATQTRHATRRPLGAAWHEAPWHAAEFARLTSPYWWALRTRPSRETLDAAAIAWWARRIAADITRAPELAGSTAWVSRNVEPALASERPGT